MSTTQFMDLINVHFWTYLPQPTDDDDDDDDDDGGDDTLIDQKMTS